MQYYLPTSIQGTKPNYRETVQHNIYKDEEKNNMFNNKQDEKKYINTFEAIKERVEYVKKISAKLKCLREEKYRVEQNNVATLNEIYARATNEKNDEKELNNCTKDSLLKHLPMEESNIQTLCTKVSHISDRQKLNDEIISEYIITANSYSISNSRKKLNSGSLKINKKNKSNKKIKSLSQKLTKSEYINNKSSIKNNSKKKEIQSKDVSKSIKKKLKNLKQKEESNLKNKDDANSITYIDEPNNSNIPKNENSTPEYNQNPAVENKQEISYEQMKTFFTNLESMLKHFLTTQKSLKSEIIASLTKLENKINLNEYKIEALMCDLEKIITTDPDANIELDIIECNTNQQVRIKDDLKCTDIEYDLNGIEQIQPHKNKMTMDSIDNTCNKKNCICNLIDNGKTNMEIKKQNRNDLKKINNDNISLCEFLKLNQEYIKPRDSAFKINPDNINAISKQNTSIETNNHTNGAEYVKNEKLQCNKNTICDFLLSQPTPEWINNSMKLDENTKIPENQYDQITKSQEEMSSTFKCRKLYNMERIVKCNNTCKNEFVYNITLKSNNEKTQANIEEKSTTEFKKIKC